MFKNKLNTALDKIENNVRENWLANDGGLTMAASDVLADISWVRENVSNEDELKDFLYHYEESIFDDLWDLIP